MFVFIFIWFIQVILILVIYFELLHFGSLYILYCTFILVVGMQVLDASVWKCHRVKLISITVHLIVRIHHRVVTMHFIFMYMMADNGGDAGVLGGSWGPMTANYRCSVLSRRRSRPTDSVVAKSQDVALTGHILDNYVHVWSSPLWYSFTHPQVLL